MDLSILDTASTANQGAKLELRDINGAPITKADGSPVTITLLGKDSDVFVKHENQVTNRRLQQGTRLKITAEALKADAIALLAKCTVTWDGVGIGEDETACSYEAAVKLYTAYPFIKEQVDEFIGDRSNFTKASPTI